MIDTMGSIAEVCKGTLKWQAKELEQYSPENIRLTAAFNDRIKRDYEKKGE